MRTVQDTYLSLFIRFLIVCKDYRTARVGKRKFPADILRALDYPESERLRRDNDIVAIAKFFPELLSVVSRISRNNAVNQC